MRENAVKHFTYTCYNAYISNTIISDGFCGFMYDNNDFFSIKFVFLVAYIALNNIKFGNSISIHLFVRQINNNNWVLVVIVKRKFRPPSTVIYFLNNIFENPNKLKK